MQPLAGETGSDSFIAHKPHSDSQLLMVREIVRLLGLISCLPEAVPHIRQGAEGEVLGKQWIQSEWDMKSTVTKKFQYMGMPLVERGATERFLQNPGTI